MRPPPPSAQGTRCRGSTRKGSTSARRPRMSLSFEGGVGAGGCEHRLYEAVEGLLVVQPHRVCRTVGRRDGGGGYGGLRARHILEDETRLSFEKTRASLERAGLPLRCPLKASWVRAARARTCAGCRGGSERASTLQIPPPATPSNMSWFGGRTMHQSRVPG